MQTPQATLNPAPRLSYKHHMAQAHGQICIQYPGTSGSQSQAYGTLIRVCRLTCIFPMAAGSPETKQPQARSPRCPHPGPERLATATAPENQRPGRWTPELTQPNSTCGQVAASAWGPGTGTRVARGPARHQSPQRPRHRVWAGVIFKILNHFTAQILTSQSRTLAGALRVQAASGRASE